jgi:hypothetical protein
MHTPKFRLPGHIHGRRTRFSDFNLYAILFALPLDNVKDFKNHGNVEEYFSLSELLSGTNSDSGKSKSEATHHDEKAKKKTLTCDRNQSCSYWDPAVQFRQPLEDTVQVRTFLVGDRRRDLKRAHYSPTGRIEWWIQSS